MDGHPRDGRGADKAVETVGAINRAANAGGQGEGGAQ